MTGFAFRLLAALLVVAGITWWWQPSREPGTTAPVPAPASRAALVAPTDSAPGAVDAAAASAGAEPQAPPAAAPPPPAVDAPGSETDAAASAAAPERVGTPRLPEPDPVELAARGAFPGEAPGDAWIDATVADEPGEAVAPDGASQDASAVAGPRDAPSEPVDLEASGDLVRRMLVLYDAMRE